MKKGVAIILLSSAGLVAAGGGFVYYYYRKQVQLLKDFKYKIVYFNIGDVQAKETDCYVTVRIYNDSTLSAEITDLVVDCYVDNKKLGRLEKSDMPNKIQGVYTDNIRSDRIIIPAKGYSDASLKVTFSPKLVLGAAVDLLLTYITQSDFSIDINGYIRGKSGFISATVELNYHTSLKEITK